MSELIHAIAFLTWFAIAVAVAYGIGYARGQQSMDRRDDNKGQTPSRSFRDRRL